MTSVALVLASLDQRSTGMVRVPARANVEVELLQHEPGIRRLVHRLLGWPQAAEVDDVVQEIFLAAWRRRETFRGDAQWSTWISRIAIRKTQNHVRWLSVRRRLFRWFDPAEDLPAPDLAEPDPRLSAAHSAMQRLQHADREVLVLRYLEDRPIAAIAAMLRISRAACDARLTRARSRLRVALPQLEDDA